MGSYSDLLLFFAVYSFGGWMMETLFASIKERKLINRGFLTGFFCPIYGFGAILIIQSSQWIRFMFADDFKSLALSILFSILLVTVLEYVTGYLLEKIFSFKWWDYSDNAFNLQGYVCLKYSLLWGLLAFLLVQVAHPAISEMVSSTSILLKGYLAVLLSLYFVADTVKSVIDAMSLRTVILNYANVPISKYYEIIIRYKRIFLAFPRLLFLNAGIINRDVRSILNERLVKIKLEFKKRFQ